MQEAELDLLVLAAQDGERRAFELLFGHYQPLLLRHAFRLSADRELAQDAVQEAWIRISRNLRKLHDPRTFRSWIYRQVRWVLIDLQRASTRRRNVTLELQQTEALAQDAVTSNAGDELLAAIDHLPALERHTLHLFYLDDLKINEIAAVLDIPPGTVKSRLNRARNLLRQRFSHTSNGDIQ